jgi:AcrR family transcriptional regulator
VTAGRATTRDRVVAAALGCLADDGLRKMTVDDVAARAGVSRATLYRAFPGGRETILAAVVDAELGRLLADVGAASARADGLRDALVEGLATAVAWLGGHPALERLMFDEPAVLLTHLEFEQMDRTLAAVRAAAAPLFQRFLDRELSERVAEWGARIVVSYLLFPSDEVDLADRDQAGWLVDRYVVPGVVALAASTGG